MATFKLKDYPAELQRKKQRVKKAALKTTQEAANFMFTTARNLAPTGKNIPSIGYVGGETFAGISLVRMNRTKYVVSSKVSGKRRGFRQNMWANQTAPFRSNRRMGVYGVSALKWTGTPRFFHIATLRTQGRFRRTARMNIKNALRTNLGW